MIAHEPLGPLQMEQGYISTVKRSKIHRKYPATMFYWGTEMAGTNNKEEVELYERYRLLFLASPDLLEACILSQEVEEHFRTCEDCDQDGGDFCEAGITLCELAEEKRKAAVAKATGGLIREE